MPEQHRTNRHLDRDRPRPPPAPAGHQRQPLRPPGRRRRPRRPAVRPDGRPGRRPQAVQVPRRRALPEDGGRDAGAFSPRSPTPATARWRSPNGPTSRSSSARSSCPISPCRRRSPPTTSTSATSRSTERGSDMAIPSPATSPSASPASSSVIAEMGFSAYFLIVWDLIRHARERGIRVGPGRGSAAGSLRGLLPAHHRPRPAALRPAVRGLPEHRPA